MRNNGCITIFLLIFLASVSFVGCVTPSSKIVKPFVEPQYDMTKQQMFDLLGKPSSLEIYKKSDQSRIEFYNYVRKYGDKDEKVPVCLINNRIVGWGRSFYEDHVSRDDIRVR